MNKLNIIGGGLAGCEAAWQAATRGIKVTLYEMRPTVMTGAHKTSNLAELVCSNSLGSNLPDRASGLLKAELRLMKSLLIECADAAAIPAGGALAVDREVFSSKVAERIESHPDIRIVREECVSVPETAAIIASGPLTSPRLSAEIAKLTGENYLYFYDAIAPVITLESINMDIAFRSSRYERGESEEGDYINCPMNCDEYERFVTALLSAERAELREFEMTIGEGVKAGADKFFEGCLPVEVIASRGKDALAFGPMRPVGLINPRTGRRPCAVVQLRQDNLAGTLYNLVGFQTNLKHPEQQKVFRMIPGLENAEFAGYGEMHRNTFIASPKLLRATLQFHNRDNLLFAGQITGVEGYAGNIATGLIAGVNAARILNGKTPLEFPPTTMMGALCYYITHADVAHFQPMKANFGILPQIELPKKTGKRKRYSEYSKRSLRDLASFTALLDSNFEDVIIG